MTSPALAPILGVVGGVASGKSLVSGLFESLGAVRIDADRIGHTVLEQPEVRDALRQRWGPSVFQSDGSVNRRAIAQRVFQETEQGRREREWLEALTHPRIEKEINRQIAANRNDDPRRPIVLDAAVLMEAGWHRFCDWLVLVDAPPALRQQRALGRGWSLDQWRSRERAQGDLEAKRRQVDFVIDNSGSTQSTRTQVQRIWQHITSQSNKP